MKENCESIQIGDIQGHERTIVECRPTVGQIALDLCPDGIPSNKVVFPVVARTDGEWPLGCGNIVAYGNDSHVAEIRLIGGYG